MLDSVIARVMVTRHSKLYYSILSSSPSNLLNILEMSAVSNETLIARFTVLISYSQSSAVT